MDKSNDSLSLSIFNYKRQYRMPTRFAMGFASTDSFSFNHHCYRHAHFDKRNASRKHSSDKRNRLNEKKRKNFVTLHTNEKRATMKYFKNSYYLFLFFPFACASFSSDAQNDSVQDVSFRKEVFQSQIECDIDLIKTKNLLRLLVAVFAASLSAMQISGFNCPLMNGCLCQILRVVALANAAK